MCFLFLSLIQQKNCVGNQKLWPNLFFVLKFFKPILFLISFAFFHVYWNKRNSESNWLEKFKTEKNVLSYIKKKIIQKYHVSVIVQKPFAENTRYLNNLLSFFCVNGLEAV